MKVLNFGSLNLDYVYQVDHFVRPGETLSAEVQTVNPGGKGLNQSIALARAGADVFHAGCVGKGGDSLRALLERTGVNTDLLVPVNTIQGNAVIQVEPGGQNCILLFGGSNHCVTEEQIEHTLSGFSSADYLVLQNEINLLPEIIERAYARGMKIFLNLSPYQEDLARVDFGKLCWLLVNEVEAFQLSGSAEPEAAWQTLHGKYPTLSLLVTLGEEGSVAFTESATVRQCAFPCRAVDTTGAGDTYTGYFIAGLTEGRSIGECMMRASMASSLSVAKAGAADSIPDRREAEIALREYGKTIL